MSRSSHLEALRSDAKGRSTHLFVARPELEAALRPAVEGRGAVLVGEPGMGKTRLAEHVLRDRRVLSMSCAELRRASASDVVASLLQGLDPQPADLVHLLQGGSAGDGGSTDEELLLRAAGHRLAAVLPPVVLLVDDAELLDAAELRRLSIVMSVSERPWVYAGRRAVDGLELPVVRVPPLEPAQARQLVDVLLPGASAEVRGTVLERAGDSPLLIEQCVRLLVENGAVTVQRDGTLALESQRVSAIPRSMRSFVDERLELLGVAESRALGVAAVLGARVELALLEFLVRDDTSAVRDLVDRGLLREGTDPSGQPIVRFSHALVREAAYERLPIAERVATHRAAADWYAVLPVSQVLESQAFHLEAAARLQRPDCDLLRRTVDAMVLYARSIEEERTQVAHQVLLRAQALAVDRAECAADLLHLELALAAVTYIAGREGDAIAAARRALELAEERQDVRAEAEAHLQLGRVATDSDPEGALHELALAQEAYSRVDDPGGEARVEVARGFVRQYDQGIPQQLESMERAYQLAVRSADTRLQAMCAQQLAMHQAFSMGRDSFEQWAERARDMSRRDDLGLEPRLQLAAAALTMFGLDALPGRELVAQAHAAGRELGLRDVYGNGLIVDLDLALLVGDFSAFEARLLEARQHAATRPTEWFGLQLDLLEARLHARRGDQTRVDTFLARVASHDMADNRVLRRDLAEARAWVALERGRFGEARALATEAVAIDLETGEKCSQLRPRLVELVATVAAGDNLSLGTIADLKALGRETGLGTVVQMATRWLYVDELTQGWTVDLHALETLDAVECRALDLEIQALAQRRFELLREAAEVWSRLGVTVWRARALLWHSELTGTPSPEADELLALLRAPGGLARQLRAQVTSLKG